MDGRVGTDFLQVLGKECLSIEREFNRRAGFTAADDRLPEWMTREPLPPHNTTFDVSEEDLDGVFNWKYFYFNQLITCARMKKLESRSQCRI
jgi:aldehyde:ferredoxin oxidoreductase